MTRHLRPKVHTETKGEPESDSNPESPSKHNMVLNMEKLYQKVPNDRRRCSVTSYFLYARDPEEELTVDETKDFYTKQFPLELRSIVKDVLVETDHAVT